MKRKTNTAAGNGQHSPKITLKITRYNLGLANRQYTKKAAIADTAK